MCGTPAIWYGIINSQGSKGSVRNSRKFARDHSSVSLAPICLAPRDLALTACLQALLCLARVCVAVVPPVPTMTGSARR